MFAGQSREALRRVFHETWRRHDAGLPLEPLQAMVRDVIVRHPEYQAMLSTPDEGRDFSPEAGETNPYLHMAMHLALHEQLSTGRPAGIRSIHERLCRQHGESHAAEHAMMDCLGEALWQAQRQGRPPDETAYLGCLRAMLARSGE